MKEISLHIPSIAAEQTVELEVTVNGQKRHMHYRVENFDWTEGGESHQERIGWLRRAIEAYDPRWELVQIGMPDNNLVPVMFRQRFEHN